MITISSRAAALALSASLFLAGSAFAQTTTPAATPAPAAKAEKPRSAASLECSKEADAKGLHGKERKKFRADCKKQASGRCSRWRDRHPTPLLISFAATLPSREGKNKPRNAASH
jgi:psiF repeat